MRSINQTHRMKVCLISFHSFSPHARCLRVSWWKFVAYERFSYDALGQQIHVRALIVDHNQTSFVDLLLLYKEGVSYEISYQNQTCKKAPLKTPFRPIEIPPDAKLQGEVVLGSSSAPGMGVLVNSWTGAVPELKAKYLLTFTEFGCLPISSLNHVENVGLILTSFYDLVIGIEDPNEFIPPPFCEKAELQQTEKTAVPFLGACIICSLLSC
uniref:Ependymin-like n=1 Tax=Paramormyrops kingsleyae TaxID=1676925 RepID=A0A3B3QB40_9TELE